jgi:beta-aspartyl-peptidase (threonine type)
MLNGHVAAATSTGGMMNKVAGRIGDSPIIGAGSYANDKTCAVSCTGKGEDFMRHLAAYDVSCRMEMAGLTISEAVRQTVFQRLPNGSGDLDTIMIWI